MNQNKKAIAQVNNTDGCSLGRESCTVFSVRLNDDDDDDDITGVEKTLGQAHVSLGRKESWKRILKQVECGPEQ
jgi:hypothetical protein